MTECREECQAGGVHSLGPRNKNGELATGEKRQVICASVTKVLRTECARAHTQRLDSHVPQAASLKVQLRKDVPGTALALMRATCKEKGERGLLAGEEGLGACAKVRLLDEHECARRFRGRREFIPPRTSGVVGCDCTEEHRLGCWPSTRRPRGRPPSAQITRRWACCTTTARNEAEGNKRCWRQPEPQTTRQASHAVHPEHDHLSVSVLRQPATQQFWMLPKICSLQRLPGRTLAAR